MYKNYSFDMWGTLIRPNPYYKVERNIFMVTYLNELGYEPQTPKMIGQVFDNVKKEFDIRSQLFGTAPNPLEMWAMVLFRLTGSVKDISQLTLAALYKRAEDIFLENPPTPFNLETLTTLEELHKRGAKMSILSNTFFIKGSTLDKVLRKINILDLFSFRHYSDEIGIMKPFSGAFQLIDIYGEKSNVIHIGDDMILDYQGAKDYGFDTLIINDGEKTISDVLNL